MAAIQYFFYTGKDWNHMFLVLIPQKEQVDKMKHFRPIALCNYIYKITSKLLANRFQKVIPFIISQPQSTFIKGRYIGKNICLTQELIKVFSSKSGKDLCFKIDIKKKHLTRLDGLTLSKFSKPSDSLRSG